MHNKTKRLRDKLNSREGTRKAPDIFVAVEVHNRFFTLLRRALVYLAAQAEVGGWSKFSISLSLRNPHHFQTKACTMVSSSTFAAKVARWLLFSVQLFLTPRDTKTASFFAGRLSKIAFDSST